MSKYTTEGLYKRIDAFKVKSAAFVADQHTLACDVLEHAAETRDVRPLQRFHDALFETMKNNATALKVWIGKVQREHPEAAFLTYKTEGGFTVAKPSEAEGIMLTLIDGLRKGTPFVQRDVKREPDMLDDLSFAKRVKALLSSAGKGHVSEALKSALTNVNTLAQARADEIKRAKVAMAATPAIATAPAETIVAAAA
jgi:hypothetical protein